jgi:hypothetical protein
MSGGVDSMRRRTIVLRRSTSPYLDTSLRIVFNVA